MDQQQKRVTRSAATASSEHSEKATSERADGAWTIREVSITPMPLSFTESSKAPSIGWSGLPSILSKATIDLAIGDKIAVELPISPIIGTLMFYYIVCDDELMNLAHYVHHINKEEHTARLVIAETSPEGVTNVRRRVTIVWF